MPSRFFIARGWILTEKGTKLELKLDRKVCAIDFESSQKTARTKEQLFSHAKSHLKNLLTFKLLTALKQEKKTMRLKRIHALVTWWELYFHLFSLFYFIFRFTNEMSLWYREGFLMFAFSWMLKRKSKFIHV